MHNLIVTLDKLKDFISFYKLSLLIGDTDPAYPCLRYIADRHLLNILQRYWLAYLYATCYCAPTAYYMFNLFPDFLNVDQLRLLNWWKNNKGKLFFQTDRAKVKNFNKWTLMIKSYREIVGDSQYLFYNKLIVKTDPILSYNNIYKACNKFFYFGRFSLFNLVLAVYLLTSISIHPSGLELKLAESCRNGLCYASNNINMITMHHKPSILKIDYKVLNDSLKVLYNKLKSENPSIPVTYWNILTVLCAYKKLYWKKRYLGYYIDRQQSLILECLKKIPYGINWNIMWEFRLLYFRPEVLGLKQGWNGIRKFAMNWFILKKIFNTNIPKDLYYKHSVLVESIGNIYKEN